MGGERYGTAEQEDGAGAKMSVQVSLFIAPPSRATLPGPDHRRSRCLHFPSAHIQEKAGAHLALNPVTSNLYSGCDITDFTPFLA